MRIFVTGGSGFVGRRLLPLLAGHEVLCLSRKDVAGGSSAAPRWIRGDLQSPASYKDALSRFRPDCCVHLAWEGLPDYSSERCRTNFLAGTELFDSLGRIGCGRIIVTGSCWEYGDRTGAVREDTQAGRLGLFAAYKAALRTVGISSCAAAGVTLAWSRVFFAYGPGQRPGSLIPTCYRSLKQGATPDIANPLAVNDFIFIDDVASAIRVLVETQDAAGDYNIGSGQPAAVWEVVNAVAERMGRRPVYADMPSSAHGLWADAGRLRSLGWAPEVSLHAGIARTLEALEKEA